MTHVAGHPLDKFMMDSLVGLSGQPTPVAPNYGAGLDNSYITDTGVYSPEQITDANTPNYAKGIENFLGPQASNVGPSINLSGLGEGLDNSYLTDTGQYSQADIDDARALFPMQGDNIADGPTGPMNPYLRSSGQSAYSNIYDNLAQSTRDLFGDVEIEDFTDQIREMAEAGRADLVDISDEQIAFLEAAFDRRTGQITDIGLELAAELGALDIEGQSQLAAVAQTAEKRQQGLLDKQKSRQASARAELGDQVSSEFESVAELTRALGANTAESSAAAMDRLQVVARVASQERLAQPAQLVAQAQLAVGDQRFQIENQIRQSTSTALRELNAGERQSVLAEAQRLAAQGYNQDMALAQALQGIEAQRAQTYIQEEQQRQARAAAFAAQAASAEQEMTILRNQSRILGRSVEELQAIGPEIVGQMMDRYYDPTGEYARSDAEFALEMQDRNIAAYNSEMEAASALEQAQNNRAFATSAGLQLGRTTEDVMAEIDVAGPSGIQKQLEAANEAAKASLVPKLSPDGIMDHFDGEVSRMEIDDFQTWRALTQQVDNAKQQLAIMQADEELGVKATGLTGFNYSADMQGADTLGTYSSKDDAKKDSPKTDYSKAFIDITKDSDNKGQAERALEEANKALSGFLMDDQGKSLVDMQAIDAISQYADSVSASPTGYSQGKYVPVQTGGGQAGLDQALNLLSDPTIRIADGEALQWQAGQAPPIYTEAIEQNPLAVAYAQMLGGFLGNNQQTRQNQNFNRSQLR